MSGQENIDNSRRDNEPAGGENWDIAAELKSLEARLASLTPRPDRLDRDRLMFLAGQAALVTPTTERRSNLAWPAAFAAMSAVAATLLVMLISRPEVDMSPSLPSATSVRQADPRLATSRPPTDLMLSPLDAHIADIDRWLKRDELGSESITPSFEQIQIRRRPILTPARWEQVLNDREPVGVSPSGASHVRQIQGART
jgi:hypothetical protein